MSLSRVRVSFSATVAVATIGALIAFGGDELNTGNEGVVSRSGWTFKGWIESKHEPSAHEQASGSDTAIVTVTGFPADKKGTEWMDYEPIGDPDPPPADPKIRVTK